MKQPKEERQLRALFSQLRDDDARSAPTFAATLAAARHREESGGRRWIFGAAAVPVAACAALAIWLTIAPDPSATQNVDVAWTVDGDWIGEWNFPTDDLLELPGGELLDTIPTLGESADFGVEFPEDPNPGADAAAIGFTRRYV